MAMNVLITTPLSASQAGGPAQYAVGLKAGLEAKEYKVELLSFESVLRYPSGIRHVVFFFRSLPRVRRADVVIVLDTWSVALPVVLAALCQRKPVILRTGGDFLWERYVERTGELITLPEFYTTAKLSLKERLLLFIQRSIIFPLTHVLVFSTTWQRDIWYSPYTLDLEKTTIIENAYHYDVSGQRDSRASNRVVWIGRDRVLKNVKALDKAIEHVRAQYPAIEYQKYTDIPHERVLEVLTGARVFVLPSISDVSPNLVLEALALGTPVLLTRECGLRHVLQDAVTWIDPKDIDDMAAHIADIMTEKGYERAKTQAQSFHATRSYTHVGDDFVKLISSL